MARPKEKDSRITSFSLNVEVLDRLTKFCKVTGIPKTKVVEKAIMSFIDKFENTYMKNK